MAAFRITDNKGFHITFPNGYTISVAFGSDNYCDNYNQSHSVKACESENAETAFWGPDGAWIAEDGKCIVQPYQTIEQVWERMQRVAAMPDPRKKQDVK